MSTLKLRCHWSLTGRESINPSLFEVLDGIQKTRSLAGAARAAGVSYRHAWDLIGRWSRQLGTPLAELTRGRGSRLTPFAEKLLRGERAAEKRIGPQLRSLAEELNRELDRSRGASPAVLCAVASHDLALGELRDQINASGRMTLEVRVAGSLDALAALARRECNIAGFHVPRLASESIAAQYAPLLRRRRWRFVHFVTREQGLIVAHGNPKRISRLGSLTRRDVRFINRQPGSGTRLLFDALLAANGLRPAQIAGYGSEEFTHAAIAATVASGAADAGFGIEAAAHRLGQSFVPLVSEDYYLALRSGDARDPAIDALVQVLRGRRFRSAVSAFPGYDVARCGEFVSPAAILQALREPSAPPPDRLAGKPRRGRRPQASSVTAR